MLPALVGFDGSALRLGVPAIEVRPMYSVEDMVRFGVAQRSELHVPVLGARF
ncbi:MAG: hypothetical protein HY744_12700 [Deltaproteobacteria bacterium]|nr:hypothetical protein [Deltaproteobacteria bacterium]